MDDREILQRISALADEEQHLEQGHGSAGVGEEGRERLAEIEVTLDQCWDLLRQRRARRAAGADPDDAAVRPESTVEHYQQ